MYTLIGGIALVLLVLMLRPAVHGTTAAWESIDDPHRQETEEETQQVHSDIWRLLALLVIVALLLFGMRLVG